MELKLSGKTIYIAAAVILGLVLLGWFLLAPSRIAVETAVAKRKAFVSTIDAEGRTRVRNKFTVTAPVSGKMSRINLNEGDSIPRDFLITDVDPSPPSPRPPSELDNRPNPYSAKVYSPAAGRILKIFDKSERYLQAGAPLLEIGDPSDIEIVIDLLSSDAVQVKPSAQVLITFPGNAEPLKARVRTIEPQAETKVSALGVEEKRVDVVADLLDKRPGFGDNFRVDAQIIVWQGENVLSVPSSALFRVGDEWKVYLVEGRKARERAVRAGHRSASEVEILDGLNEGETVVLHPPGSLTDGSPVSIE